MPRKYKYQKGGDERMNPERIKMLQELHNKESEDKFNDGNSGTLRERLDSIKDSNADSNIMDDWYKKSDGINKPAKPNKSRVGSLKDDYSGMYDKFKDLKPVEGIGGWKGKPVPGMFQMQDGGTAKMRSKLSNFINPDVPTTEEFYGDDFDPNSEMMYTTPNKQDIRNKMVNDAVKKSGFLKSQHEYIKDPEPYQRRKKLRGNT